MVAIISLRLSFSGRFLGLYRVFLTTCYKEPKVLGFSAASDLKSGQFDRERNLTKCNSIFLTGLTGWTGYSYTKANKS
jgi:hypothetical protein